MGESPSYAERAIRYANRAVAGEIPAAKPTILACQRFLDDLVRTWQFVFDQDRANRYCAFIECLPHIKGKWAKRNETIHLEDWQCFLVANVFGWIDRKTGLRRFRIAYTEVPRKNAKSTIAAGVGIACETLDGEPGAEVYSAATTREQARIVWDTAKQMCRKDREMCAELGIEVRAHALWCEESGSVFRALSADGETLDGLNIHCAIVDELHAHPTRKVWDVLETATGSREQPLLFAITTAGSNRAGICYEQRDYALKVLNGVVDDPSYFGLIYTIDDGDDWTTEIAWRKANPNYGVSVNPEDLARKCLKAQQQTAAQNNFLTKHLDVWVNADTAWMDMRAWDRQRNDKLSLDDFEGRRCYIGIDLASRIDVASIGYWFPPVDGGKHAVFHVGYLPEETIENSDNSQYAGWAMDGHLIASEGAMTDQDAIKDRVLADCRRFQVVAVGVDPFQAHKFLQELAAEDVPVLEYNQTVRNMSEPMKDFEALVVDGKLEHSGDPCLTWMMSNVVCHVDAKDNVYPRKEFAANKIDGPVALIMARGLALRDDETTSIYETEEMVVL